MTTMRTLLISAGYDDHAALFVVDLNSFEPSPLPRLRTCNLLADYPKSGDENGKPWMFQISQKRDDRLIPIPFPPHDTTPISHGELVEVDGQVYTVRILGDFNDIALLDLVT